jgi:23S rRNA (guanosine2251-2'-O)-methyltransferase
MRPLVGCIYYNVGMMKLNAKELRTAEGDPEAAKTLPKNDITIIIDNVLDTYNVGSIFRLADAVAAKKVYLCGETLSPPNTRIKKASINTWQWVDWEYKPTAVEAIDIVKLQNPKTSMVAVEQDPRSIPFQSATFALPIAIVVGNESYGVSKAALDAADVIVELPMWGVNKSLNVMVSCGIVLYGIMKNHA